MKPKSNTVECHISVNYILYPKAGYCLEPGTFLVFKANVKKIVNDKNDLLKGFNNGIICSGEAPSIQDGKIYYLAAELVEHKKYGKQFKIICMNELSDYTTPEKKKAFLQYVLSDDKINKLYQYLEDPFSVIEAGDVHELCQIPGIGERTAECIIKKYKNGSDSGGAVVELYEMGFDKNTITRLTNFYGSSGTALFKIRENPYTLISDVPGYGWKKTDDLAVKSGFGKFSEQRIGGFIQYVLGKEAENGNSWVESSKVITTVRSELGVTDEYRQCVKNAFAHLIKSNIVWASANKRYIALKRIRDLEQHIAEELFRLYDSTVDEAENDINSGIERAETELGIQYTDEQKQAIKTIVSNNVCILTGLAGTGKSTVVAAVLKILDGRSYAQCALSGRAAARMQEITDKEGSTIHRLLGYKPESGFMFNKENPLEEQLIILDETSMVGADLFLHLIRAIKTGSRLIMIGDDGQLESIGECNIFKDMLNSNYIPVARLTKIHRQAEKSAIITDSIRVRNAIQLTPYGWVGKQVRGELEDLELDVYSSSTDSFSHIMSQFKRIYQESNNNCNNIQIVLPQKTRGSICTLKVNQAVQEIVNPDNGQASVKIGFEGNDDSGYFLRVGDSVIVNRNNYNTSTVNDEPCPIYNGNKGKIVSIDTEGNKRKMVVDFDQWGEVVIPRQEDGVFLWGTIELAYALTCHKLQGSEAPNIIIGIDNSARIMLTREWLYTAITRAKQHCVLCAEGKALNYAISTSKVPMKQTFLVEFIKKYFKNIYQ